MAGLGAAGGAPLPKQGQVSIPVGSWASVAPDPVAEMWDAGVVVAFGTGCRADTHINGPPSVGQRHRAFDGVDHDVPIVQPRLHERFHH